MSHSPAPLSWTRQTGWVARPDRPPGGSPHNLLPGSFRDQGPIELLGIRLEDVTIEVAVAHLLAALEGDAPARVHFVNAHCLRVAARDEGYRRALRNATRLYADGSGVRWGARVLCRRALCDNVNGSDLLPPLCQALAVTGHRVFLLGGGAGVAERAREQLLGCWPTLRICGTHHGYLKDDSTDLVSTIRAASTDLLLVAMGVPAQELWIERHHAATGARVAMGVGALLDFCSGRIRRAPAWLRHLGLEWTWRLLLEPSRLSERYLLGIPWFVGRILAERRRQAQSERSLPWRARR